PSRECVAKAFQGVRQGVPRGARADDVASSQTVVRPPLPRAEATLAAGRHHSQQHLTFNGTFFPAPATISPARPDRPSGPPAVAPPRGGGRGNARGNGL